jgi:hypothetical protein
MPPRLTGPFCSAICKNPPFKVPPRTGHIVWPRGGGGGQERPGNGEVADGTRRVCARRNTTAHYELSEPGYVIIASRRHCNKHAQTCSRCCPPGAPGHSTVSLQPLTRRCCWINPAARSSYICCENHWRLGSCCPCRAGRRGQSQQREWFYKVRVFLE